MQSSHPQVAQELRTVPDDELLRRLAELLAGSRHTEADLVASIGEVDARRLYAREATASMFAYCTERLHLSEGEACLRIAAARASREHPVLLELLAGGRAGDAEDGMTLELHGLVAAQFGAVRSRPRGAPRVAPPRARGLSQRLALHRHRRPNGCALAVS